MARVTWTNSEEAWAEMTVGDRWTQTQMARLLDVQTPNTQVSIHPFATGYAMQGIEIRMKYMSREQ